VRTHGGLKGLKLFILPINNVILFFIDWDFNNLDWDFAKILCGKWDWDPPSGPSLLSIEKIFVDFLNFCTLSSSPACRPYIQCWYSGENHANRLYLNQHSVQEEGRGEKVRALGQ
jgi:hypothetical protein